MTRDYTKYCNDKESLGDLFNTEENKRIREKASGLSMFSDCILEG